MKERLALADETVGEDLETNFKVKSILGLTLPESIIAYVRFPPVS